MPNVNQQQWMLRSVQVGIALAMSQAIRLSPSRETPTPANQIQRSARSTTMATALTAPPTTNRFKTAKITPIYPSASKLLKHRHQHTDRNAFQQDLLKSPQQPPQQTAKGLLKPFTQSTSWFYKQQLTEKKTLRFEALLQLITAFDQGIPWTTAIRQVEKWLMRQLGSSFQLCYKHDATLADEVHCWLQSLPRYEMHAGGGRFEKLDQEEFGDHWHTIFRHTQIRTIEGERYELLNRIYPDEVKSLRQQCDIKVDIGKSVLGKGHQGKVRIARRIHDHKFMAVKKIIEEDDPDAFKTLLDEIDLHRHINSGEHLVKLYGTAHLHDHFNRNKTYLLMDLAGEMDGFDAITSLTARTHQNRLDAKIQWIATQYVQAVKELHAQQIYHLDIKIENYIHHLTPEDESIKLCDFGLSITDQFANIYSGTSSYLAPEVIAFPPPGKTIAPHLIDNVKRDAWALGICLLKLKFQQEPANMQVCQLILASSSANPPQTKPTTLHFDGLECTGVENTVHLKGETLDEVIAKLLDKDPTSRITPTEALQLPYFELKQC